MNLQSIISTLIVVTLLFSCTEKKKNTTPVSLKQTSDFITKLEYAKNLEITKEGEITTVRVLEPFKGAAQKLEYILVPKGAELPETIDSKNVIRTPINRLVCTSTTFLPALEMLDGVESLVGYPSTKYISSQVIKKRVDEGHIVDLGQDSKMNVELLLELEPELVLTYTVAGSTTNYDQISQVGIPVVIGAGYLEEEPLGRAEWIKLMALFLGKEREADSVFTVIKKNYEEVLALAESVENQPTVFTSTVYKDVWYMPGGESWAGKYFKYAGADYLWKDNPETGSMELSFEAVYDEAHDAEYWIGTNSYSSITSLLQADERYKNFGAVANRQVYSFNKRLTPQGGNDYFESGIARPDLVLKDIVKILHPELLPEHELYFHEKLHE